MMLLSHLYLVVILEIFLHEYLYTKINGLQELYIDMSFCSTLMVHLLNWNRNGLESDGQ